MHASAANAPGIAGMEHARDFFGSCHPAVVFGFFIGAIVLVVIVNNPVFLVTAVLCAALFYLCVHGRRGFKVLLGMVLLFVLVMCINPLFAPMGDTVLFTYLGNRHYTAEALGYGACTACMLVASLLWFFSFNKVMTTEKFTYLFGGLAPGLTLVFTMVLRLVPTYQRKASEITTARASIGRGIGSGGSFGQRARAGVSALSALVTWALEGAIITADSMRSRGYGTDKRSSYACYSLTMRDVILACILVVLFACACVSIASGACNVDFYPSIVFAPMTSLGVAGFFAFTAFMLTPSVFDIGEVISCRISESRI